eukprot:CAMPEP_0205956572 /NCGR_PEP_ID=MMETSP1459-20131121/38577_1 /ASSEMBLY_ACC=CAM_ASM_001120 /TAXON_ID=41880 /ORGANISM="Pycnococcus provasolii, Strain RCC931" /LENGTH=147 /DNA_ID=CAMNT_0053328983 /DNA_START=174 /DNA_END=615 /DNA_ORIENTATION=-
MTSVNVNYACASDGVGIGNAHVRFLVTSRFTRQLLPLQDDEVEPLTATPQSIFSCNVSVKVASVVGCERNDSHPLVVRLFADCVKQLRVDVVCVKSRKHKLRRRQGDDDEAARTKGIARDDGQPGRLWEEDDGSSSSSKAHESTQDA